MWERKSFENRGRFLSIAIFRKVPVVAVVAESIVAGPVAVVALHFNVTALSAGTVVMEHARIDELTRFTAGVEGFNSWHSASQCLGVVVRKAVHVMRGSLFSSQPSKS